MELPKETIERIRNESDEYSIELEHRQDYYEGKISEARFSLSEIEKLKEDREKRIAYELILEDKNKELMEALKVTNEIANILVETINVLSEIEAIIPKNIEIKIAGLGKLSEDLSRKYNELNIQSLLKSLPNKEA